jgi:hypothetical protein
MSFQELVVAKTLTPVRLDLWANGRFARRNMSLKYAIADHLANFFRKRAKPVVPNER